MYIDCLTYPNFVSKHTCSLSPACLVRPRSAAEYIDVLNIFRVHVLFMQQGLLNAKYVDNKMYCRSTFCPQKNKRTRSTPFEVFEKQSDIWSQFKKPLSPLTLSPNKAPKKVPRKAFNKAPKKGTKKASKKAPDKAVNYIYL